MLLLLSHYCWPLGWHIRIFKSLQKLSLIKMRQTSGTLLELNASVRQTVGWKKKNKSTFLSGTPMSYGVFPEQIRREIKRKLLSIRVCAPNRVFPDQIRVRRRWKLRFFVKECAPENQGRRMIKDSRHHGFVTTGKETKFRSHDRHGPVRVNVKATSKSWRSNWEVLKLMLKFTI